MMLSSPDDSRSALLGFDPDMKTAFVFMFGDEMKIASLYIKYTDEDQEEKAKKSMSLSLMLWLNSADNGKRDELITKAAAEEVIEHFLKSVPYLNSKWEVWAERYDEKTDKMIRVK